MRDGHISKGPSTNYPLPYNVSIMRY